MEHLFIVGAQRSGSTYLYEMLDCHPEISMVRPAIPEPKFFLNSELVKLGGGFYKNLYFSNPKNASKYFGEKSTSYIESLEAAKSIKAFFPMARILIILRNPVKRAHSNYKFSVSHQLESLSFQEALMAEAVRLSDAKFITSVNPYAYERRGHYIDYIRQYAEIFSADQMKVLIFEEFVGSIQSIQSLYRWLGITEEFVPEHLNKVVNPSVVRNEDYGEVNKILAEGYQDSIRELEKFLGRKIQAWHNYFDSL